jgi:chemotaxis protein histidine kinase CheA
MQQDRPDTLKTAMEGNRIQVTVTDNGRGMDWLEGLETIRR